jgi:hypothetical protein
VGVFMVSIFNIAMLDVNIMGIVNHVRLLISYPSCRSKFAVIPSGIVPRESLISEEAASPATVLKDRQVAADKKAQKKKAT